MCRVKPRQAQNHGTKDGWQPQLPLPQLDTLVPPHFSFAIENSIDQAQPISASMAMLKCFETMSTDDKENLLDYAINHIFLPPRLPNASDHSPNLEAGLIALVREFADQFDQDKDAQSTDWVTVTSMLASMSRVHDGRAMSEHTVAKEIESMRCGGRTI